LSKEDLSRFYRSVGITKKTIKRAYPIINKYPLQVKSAMFQKLKSQLETAREAGARIIFVDETSVNYYTVLKSAYAVVNQNIQVTIPRCTCTRSSSLGKQSPSEDPSSLKIYSSLQSNSAIQTQSRRSASMGYVSGRKKISNAQLNLTKSTHRTCNLIQEKAISIVTCAKK